MSIGGVINIIIILSTTDFNYTVDSLESIFEKFCKYMDGRLRWSDSTGIEWTKTVFEFFSSIKGEYEEQKNYLLIDYIWRDRRSDSVEGDIILAVEHENESSVDEILTTEILHLIDIKATNKIGIFYPSVGDEEAFIKNVEKKIQSRLYRLAIATVNVESYLIILGFATTKEAKRAIMFRGRFLNALGNITDTRTNVVYQKIEEGAT